MKHFTASTVTSLAFRLALVNFLVNLSIESSFLFLPLHAQSLGASNLEIGFIAAAYGLAFFLASFIFGRLSDLHGRIRFIQAGLGITAIAYCTQIAAPVPMILLVIRGCIGFSLGVASAALTAYTYDAQKQIGNFASFGALGWLGGALAAAIINSIPILFIVSSLCTVTAFFIAFSFKETARHSVHIDVFPVRIFKANLKVYFSFFIRQFGAMAIWSIFPLYLTSIGATKTWIAIIDMTNMVTQFIIMRLTDKYDPGKIYKIGLFLSVVAFIAYAFVPGYLFIIPAQIIIGISWSFIFVGALNYLLLRNEERGTTSGLFLSTLYLSNGLGPFIGGGVSQLWGYTMVLYVGAGLNLISFLTAQGLGTRKKKN